MQDHGDLLARSIHSGFGFLPKTVNGRWIPKSLTEIRKHRIEHTRVNGSSGSIIQINHEADYTLPLAVKG